MAAARARGNAELRGHARRAVTISVRLPIRVAHRRSGTADSIASRTSVRGAAEWNGPRQIVVDRGRRASTVRRGKRSFVSFRYAYLRHDLPWRLKRGWSALDQAQLAHLGFERRRAHPVVDRCDLAQQLRHLAPIVGAKYERTRARRFVALPT